MDKIINLRIHHFYDILRNFGQDKKIKPHPYLHSFHKVAELIRHNSNLKIKITISCDSICENCIHYKNGICDDLITHRKDFSSKEALNNYIDKRIMKKCLLKKGDILTPRQLCEKAELYLDNIEFIYSGNDLEHTKKRKKDVINGLKYYNEIIYKNQTPK